MNSKIPILHIITNLELGGAQKNALAIISGLDDSRYLKHFISAPQGLLQEECLKIPNVNVCFLPRLRREISPLDDILCFFSLLRYMKKNHIALVHTHSSKAGIIGRWAAYFAEAPVIIHTIHGWSFNNYLPALLKYFYIFLEKITGFITTRFIAVCESDIEKGLQNGIGKRQKYTLIHYGISLDEIKQGIFTCYSKKELNINTNFCVGMIACLKPQKNPLDFIYLAAKILKVRNDVSFFLIGGGPQREALSQAIKREKIFEKVFLLGWRKDVYRILPLFDAVILTSLWEGMPITLLEAMACSKPVVAYDVDGISEIVKDAETGFLVPARDVNMLAEKLKNLLDNKVLSSNIGNQARQLVSNPEFSVKGMLENLESVYTALYPIRENHRCSKW